MEKLSVIKISIIIFSILFVVVGAYIFGVGILGGAEFSLNANDWVSFSSYFNGILSPLLAAIAAATAFFSLTYQLNLSRKDSSLNEQISNYLKHIEILQRIIEKRWTVIKNFSNLDWESETFTSITEMNIKEKLLGFGFIEPEIIEMYRIFEDLVDAMQWYSVLHKKKIDLDKNYFPKSEWSHFSASMIREQDKKLKFCYEYCLWVLSERSELHDDSSKEHLVFRQFYEGLKSDGILDSV